MINTVHEKLQAYIDNQDIAGASIIVRKGGEVIHEEYLGHADIAAGVPVSPDTIFRLASMTKPVIAVAIMAMADRGLLSITDPIAKYIPGFADMKVARELLTPDMDPELLSKKADLMEYESLARPITIEDLLRHRSGLGHGYLSARHGVGNRVPCIDLAQRVENIIACPMDFQPGAGTGYSAVTAFDVLGRILEIISGNDLESLLDEIIFVPLGMRETAFRLTDAMIPRVPRLYARPNDALIDTAPAGKFVNHLSFSYPSGSGGLYSTLRDYDRFTHMLANGGELDGKRILNADTVSAMAARCPSDPPHFTWGLGMNVFSCYSRSGRYLSEGTFGWSGAFGTHFYIDPTNDLCMTLMVNRADINGASSYVSHGVEEAIFKGLSLRD